MSLTMERLITIRARMKMLNRLDKEEAEIEETLEAIADFPDAEVSRVLYMKYVQGHSWARIGVELGMSPDAVRMYAMRRLRERSAGDAENAPR